MALGVLFGFFCLALMSKVVEAKPAVVSVKNSHERGTYISVAVGKSWAKKLVVIEVGVKSGKSIRWTKVATSRSDSAGNASACGSKSIPAKSQLRVRVAKKVIGSVTVRKTVVLSGCGYVPTATATPGTTATPSSTTSTTTPSTTLTTLPPPSTTSTTSTTLPLPSAPNGLALTTSTDTGDSNSDGITKSTTPVLKGAAPAGSVVTTTVDGVAAGPGCTANGSGQFTCALGTVAEGTHVVRAVATVGATSSVPSSGFTIKIDLSAPTMSMSTDYTTVGDYGTANVTITLSENSSTFTTEDLTVLCTDGVTCTVSNFAGSGSNYTVKYNHANNQGNGGAISVASGSFADVAGNLNSSSRSIDIGLDDQPPQVTSVVWDSAQSILIVSFDEKVVWSGLYDSAFEDWAGGSFVGMHPAGQNLSSLRNPSGDKRTWYIDVGAGMVSALNDPGTRANTHLNVGISVTDIWIRPIQNSSHEIT